MKTKLVSRSIALSIFLASQGFATPTFTPVTVTPLNGMESVPSERSCFSSGWSRLTNSNCSGKKKWFVDVPVGRIDKWYGARVPADGGAQGLDCWFTFNSADGTYGWASVDGLGGPVTWTLTFDDIYVDGGYGGVVMLECDLSQGATIAGVHYWWYD
jgi:hypothetical protein